MPRKHMLFVGCTVVIRDQKNPRTGLYNEMPHGEVISINEKKQTARVAWCDGWDHPICRVEKIPRLLIQTIND